jgi:hypothetical protein
MPSRFITFRRDTERLAFECLRNNNLIEVTRGDGFSFRKVAAGCRVLHPNGSIIVSIRCVDVGTHYGRVFHEIDGVKYATWGVGTSLEVFQFNRYKHILDTVGLDAILAT